jgi:hypothetical protein
LGVVGGLKSPPERRLIKMNDTKIKNKEIEDIELKRRIGRESFAPSNAYEKMKLVLRVNQQLMEQKKQVLHPCLVGGSSSGKSSRVYQLAEEMKKEVFVLNTTQYLPEDIGGIPKIDGEITRYTLPEWVVSHIVFFDEIDKIIDQRHKIAPLLTIMSDRRLHGKKLENIFLFAAQVAEDIRFLEYLNEKEEYSDALSRRLLIIPCYYAESIEYLRKKGMKRITIDGRDIDKKIREWKLNFFLPFHYEYIFEFTKIYSNMLPDYLFETVEEREQYIKNVLLDLFYYFEQEGVLNAIEDALDTKTEIRSIDEEEVMHYEIVKNFKKFSVVQVYSALANIQSKITAKEFYTAFLYAYSNSSQDERSVFFKNLFENVKEKGEFTSSNEYEVIYWHIVAALTYLKHRNELPFPFSEIPEWTQQNIIQMEKEVYGV